MANISSDPEVRYREGFKAGAKELLKGIEHFLPTVVSDDAYHWVEQQIEKWLSSAKNIASEGNTAPSSSPPPFRTPRAN
jgi:hypothetical protein